MNGTTLEQYLKEVVYIATHNIGFGETRANNQGRFLDIIGVPPGAEWCAGFARYCYRRAAKNLGIEVPFKTNTLGAKKLGKNMAAVGRKFTDVTLARPGDLVVWHRRTGLISWKGHVGIVKVVDSDAIMTSIEGNVGRFPAKVRAFQHDVTKERLAFFASLRR